MPAARPYLVFDTETTDLLPDPRHPDRDPFMVSLAWGLYSPEGEPQQTYYAIVRPRPGRPIPEEGPAFEKHRITNAVAQAEGRPRTEVLTAFLDAIRGAGAIVAHKLRFDHGILERELAAARVPRRDREALEAVAGYCTMNLADEHRNRPGSRPLRNLGLPAVHEWATGVPLVREDGVHSAVQDMHACARIFFALPH